MTSLNALTALYLRISQDRMGLQYGVTSQHRLGLDLAERRALGDPVVFKDNDISAKDGKDREGYDALVEAIKAGLVKCVVVLHTSRIWRNRRERAEGIALFAKHGVSVVCVLGPDLDLTTAQGRLLAGLLGEFDTAESEIKAERNAIASGDRAKCGDHNGARPLYGYKLVPDGVSPRTGKPVHRWEIDEVQAADVRGWFEAFLSGRKVSSLAKAAGVDTKTMRNRLCNLAYAGIRVHHGTEYPAKWPAIIKDRATVDACRSLLTDPKRATTGGTMERKYIGSGVYRCERCAGRTVYTSGSGKGNGSRTVYRCRPDRGGCGRQWDLERVDAVVHAAVEYRLGRPDLADLLPADRPDLDALNQEAQGIRERLRTLAADFVTLDLDAGQVKEANRRGKERLAAIEAELAKSVRGRLVGTLVAAEDPVGLWRDAATADARQVILRAVMTVTLTAPRRGMPPADWDRSVDWYSQSVRITSPDH